ncbi:MAG: hypothetical protein KC731_27680, partial [Myxococcales bacterium]|nr:hypothetical protein [Myxococcales bacterium]
PKPPPPPAPTATAEASASAAATPTDAPPPTLLGSFAKAAKIKLRRVAGAEEVVIDAPDEVKVLLDAIGLDQTPGNLCPRCIPDVQLVFEDGIGTRLGSLGLFCDGTDGKVAVLRDALANDCTTVLPKDAAALEAAVQKALSADSP